MKRIQYPSIRHRFYVFLIAHTNTSIHQPTHTRTHSDTVNVSIVTKNCTLSQEDQDDQDVKLQFSNGNNFLPNETQVTTRIGHTNLNSSQIRINNDLNKNRYTSPATYKTSTRQLEDTTNQMPFKQQQPRLVRPQSVSHQPHSIASYRTSPYNELKNTTQSKIGIHFESSIKCFMLVKLFETLLRVNKIYGNFANSTYSQHTFRRILHNPISKDLTGSHIKHWKAISRT